MQGFHDLSPVASPRVTAAYTLTSEVPKQKFTFQADDSFEYAEEGAARFDEDVVNFESDEEVPPFREMPGSAEPPVHQFVPQNWQETAGENPFPVEEPEPREELPAEKLPVNEQLTHAKWQVRLRTYQDIAKCFETGVDVYSDKDASPYEHYAGWLKDMATDKNLTAQMEGLRAMAVYISKVQEMPQTTFLIAVDLLEKCPITKPAYAAIIFQIYTLLLVRDTESVFLGELIKRVSSKRVHEVVLILRALSEHAHKKQLSPSQSVKAVEAGRVALLHSHNEVRAMGHVLCLELYHQTAMTKEAFFKGFKDVKPAIVKELSEAMELIEKEKKVEIPPLALSEAHNLLQFDAPNADFVSAGADLRALLHPKFAENAYITNIKMKQEVLFHLKKGLSAVAYLSESPENLHTLNLLLNYMDDLNALVYSEVMQVLELLVLKCPSMFASRWKQLTFALCEKLKGSRKQAKAQVHKLLSAMCTQKIVTMLDMCDLLVDLAKTHKNPQVREDALAWISLELGKMEGNIQRETDLISGGQTLREPVAALSAAISKRLYMIIKKDVTGQVRDQAVKSLTILLRLLVPETEAYRALEELVNTLHPGRAKEMMQKAPARPSTAPSLPSVSLLDMDLPCPAVPEEPISEQIPASEPTSEANKTGLGEWVRQLVDSRGSVHEFSLLLSSAGQEEVSSVLKDLMDSFQWVLLRCGGQERVSTVADACSYLSALVFSLGACHAEDLVPLLNLILLASSFNVCTQDLLSTMDVLYRISSKIAFLKGLIRTVLNLRIQPWTHIPTEQLLTLVRFSTNWVEHTSRVKAAVNYFQRAKAHECFHDNAYQQNYNEALLKEVEEFRTVVLAAEGENMQMKATDVLRRLRQIEKMLKQEAVEMRVEGLEEFLKLAKHLQTEQAPKLSARHRRETSNGESNPPTQRNSALPVMIAPLEELERLLQTIGSALSLPKSAVETEAYQAKTFVVIRTLRELISPTEAESLFHILALSLPVSPFNDPFNSKAYGCFSDWLIASPIGKIAKLVTRLSNNNTKVAIHLLKWLAILELKSKEYQLSDLTEIAISIVTGLNPTSAGITLFDEDAAVYRSASEEILVYLMSKFNKDATIKFLELQLVSCGRLFQEFAKWLDFKFPGQFQASISVDFPKITPPSPLFPNESHTLSDLEERLRIETFAHDQTQHLLEKVNSDYLTQATANYQLQQDLQSCKAENTRLQLEVLKLRAILAQKHTANLQEPWGKPITTLEELTSGRVESGTVTPRVDIFAEVHGGEAKFADLAQEGDDAALCLFQYLLITSANPGRDLTLPLLATYESLEEDGKTRLLRCISASISQDDVVKSISTDCLKGLFQFTLKYLSCASPASALQELQHLLGSLLDVTDRSRTLCSLIIVLNEGLPEDFGEDLPSARRAFIRLCVKCLLTVAKSVSRMSGLFNIWLELYRLFDRHPPETLTVCYMQNECPNIGDLEQVFKALRGLSDHLLEAEPKKAFSFLRFIVSTSSKAGSSLYIRYLASVLDKRHALRLSLG